MMSVLDGVAVDLVVVQDGVGVGDDLVAFLFLVAFAPRFRKVKISPLKSALENAAVATKKLKSI